MTNCGVVPGVKMLSHSSTKKFTILFTTIYSVYGNLCNTMRCVLLVQTSTSTVKYDSVGKFPKFLQRNKAAAASTPGKLPESKAVRYSRVRDISHYYTLLYNEKNMAENNNWRNINNKLMCFIRCAGICVHLYIGR